MTGDYSCQFSSVPVWAEAHVATQVRRGSKKLDHCTSILFKIWQMWYFNSVSTITETDCCLLLYSTATDRTAHSCWKPGNDPEKGIKHAEDKLKELKLRPGRKGRKVTYADMTICAITQLDWGQKCATTNFRQLCTTKMCAACSCLPYNILHSPSYMLQSKLLHFVFEGN